MSVTTTKVTGTPTVAASSATARMGDGIRASGSPQAFAPIVSIQSSAGAGSEEHGLRNQDDYGGGQGFDQHQAPYGSDTEDGVRFGTVRTSNTFTRAMFEMRSGFEVTTPSQARLPEVDGSRFATDIYETNVRVVAARFAGEKLIGNTVNRYY